MQFATILASRMPKRPVILISKPRGPAMSTECERAFSSTKKLVTPERNWLAEEVIEASEYLKNWWDRGLYHNNNPGARG
jgi:hypothetical protein